MELAIAIVIAIVVITLFCRACVTIERIKGVSQNAGVAETYSSKEIQK